ncbi:glucan 1,6-alpha-glucosidase [Fusarium heterosporum]|uniref:Glucan 1,6-alpha-glucosidase n=1 Tax=Fusarium heterosporum TaxID=42747 RepID=A0A8H5WAJ9_FUSHE|nr:glucan 1,6-alpha-glucosidase [Fusarium heterosporum]
MIKKIYYHEPTWWKHSVVYQIYPASFKDSNGDGIGDIPGIISKLDYIRDLGVDIIWLSPHYKSPQVDMGYDVSDFQDVHEPYGTLEDCQLLIQEIHDRGMKVIFDLVINHTSDQHPWFIESKSSTTNSKRDWYFWRQPKTDTDGRTCRPNNWRSQFTKPAWTFDDTTQEYYLHVYASGQPDLNWENEACRSEIYDNAIKFWLDRGVDGFRVDTVNKFSKVSGLPDAPVVELNEQTQTAVCHYANGPRIHEYLREMKQVMAPYDTMTVGELPNTPNLEDVLKYISPGSEPGSQEIDMVFNFDTVNLGQTPGNRFLPIPFDNSDFKRCLTKWQKLPETTGAWTTVFLENHDQGRSVSRFASDLPKFRERAAKMLATLLATMTGTLFLYQGQEIGMINAPDTWSADDYKCVRSVNYVQDVRQRTNQDPDAIREATKNLQRVARDHARVPMQWDNTPNAGFTSRNAVPWMPVLESFREINVANQLGNKTSILEYWREILKLRKKYSSLFVYGTFTALDVHQDLLAFIKTDSKTGARALTVANLSQPELVLPEIEGVPFGSLQPLMSNYTDAVAKSVLGPYEARVYLLSQM